MKLEYLGHSSFRITDKKILVIDPYADIGYSLPQINADIVTVSHSHYDHSASHLIGGNPLVINTADKQSFGGIKIEGLLTFHDEQGGAKRGENIVYKIEVDGAIICHLGDIGQALDNRLLEFIKNADILLIPIGGKYTIDAAAAKEFIDAAKPNIAVPMHFKTDDLNIDIAPIESFTRLFDSRLIKNQKSISKLDISKNTQIIVLERFKG